MNSFLKRFHIKKIKYKFLILFFIISIIPILFVSIYSSKLVTESNRQKTEQATISQLENIDRLVYERIKGIQKSINVIRYDDELQRVLLEHNISNDKFSKFIVRKLKDISEITSIIFVLNNGDVYSYGNGVVEIDSIKLQMLYPRISESSEYINWFGATNQPVGAGKKNTLMAVTTFFDENSSREYKELAKVYFEVDGEFLSNLLYNDKDGSILNIYDKSFRLITANSLDRVLIDLTDYIDMSQKLFLARTGTITGKIKGEDVVITHYTSNITEWKFVKIQPYNVFYSELSKITTITMWVILFIFVIIILAYIYMNNNIIKPLIELNNKMKSFNSDDLNVFLPIKSDDEIGMITSGFNKMVSKISNMIDEVKTSEREKNKAVIRALSYQLNPHFLLNTLASIRIMAMKENATKISDVLMLLNRLVRNTLSNGDKLITLKDEISNLMDYIELLQIRYNGKLNVTYDIEKGVENCLVPNLFLQPIVENSVVHGLTQIISSSSGTAKIALSIHFNQNDIIIEILDNGVGIDKEKMRRIFEYREEKSENRIGIKNTDERIKLLFGNKYGIQITTAVDKFTNVKIVLPGNISIRDDRSNILT